MKKLLLPIPVIALIGIGIYFSFQNKEERQLQCSNSKFTTSHHQFSKDRELLEKARKAFSSGDIEVKSNILYPKYSESSIKNSLDLSLLNDIVLEEVTLLIGKQPNKQKEVLIDIILQENDREDPNKQNDFCKIYAGSVKVQISYKNQKVYGAYSEFLSFSKVREQIACILKGFSRL